jgi:multiple sugar transport system substrate-binding protein
MKPSRIVLCFVLLFLLVGLTCVWAGGKPEEKKTETTMAAEREKSHIEIYNPGFTYPTERIKITVWDYYSDRPYRHAMLQGYADEYMKIHPNVDVEIVHIAFEGFKAKYQSAFQAGTGPDLATFDVTLAHSWGVSVPAPDWAVKAIETEYSDIAKPRMVFYDKYWGWPSQVDAEQMTYYNRAMFREAGLDPAWEAFPKTLPELLEAMKKTTKYDSSGTITQGGWAIRYFGATQHIGRKWAKFLFCFRDGRKGWVFNEDYTDVPFEEPEYVEALQFYKDMVWKWKVASIQFPKPNEAFALGLGCMTNRESFLVGHLKKEAPDLDYGIAPLVNGAPPHGKYEVGVQGTRDHMTVTAKKNVDIAWDVNLWLNKDEYDLELSKEQGGFPAKKANMDSNYVKNEIPYSKTAQVMFARAPLKVEVDPYGVFVEVEHQIGAAVEAVLAGTQEPKPALKAAADRARKIIAEAKAKK